MDSEYSGDFAAAFWLTMEATPEGAQGQVTFQLSVFLPQPTNMAAIITTTRTRDRIRFIMIFSS
jgi:hypothetical protein